ncbi:diguanylate cyclase (GGDEF)-like protein [Metabacillus crassostreae]|uniref:sensor domain-containing diguanylate cyclase n=1 Tax=Metabacillus crassostreae TaxID=929098 RepID=UPI001956FF0D|nr:diguanylate cyclase [Metabacillus crassostreae]MBM7605233.1 diguanylate cyclase (GGDEF)-like protein [Metabacillus crassostreae]
MTLRKKLLFASIGIITFFMIIIMVIGGMITSKIHSIYEREQVTKQMNQTQNLIKNEIDDLNQLNLDYAAWVDTSKFIQDENSEYIESNFTEETFEQNRIDQVLFLNQRGQFVYSSRLNPTGELAQNVAEPEWLDLYHLKKPLSPDERISGVIQTSEGITLISSHPILNSHYEGPSKGTLIFTREFDQELINEIGDTIELELSLFQNIPKELNSLQLKKLGADDLYIHELNDTEIAGYSTLSDLLGNQISYVEVKSERTIYKNGRLLVLLNLISLLVLVTIICTVIYYTFDKIFASRIIRLKQSVIGVRSCKKLGNRVGKHGEDEIGDLANQINEMLDALETYSEKWKQRANYDSLTNLPNREFLTQLITEEMTKKGNFSVFFMDLDGFKDVNDTYGHETGDKLLQVVSERLKNVVRSGDAVSRLGGDEFVLLIKKASDQQIIIDLAERIVEVVSEPFHINSSVINVSASIGIATYPQHGADYRSLVKNADEAMYKAKRNGKNNYYILN